MPALGAMESITYDPYGNYYWLKTYSVHQNNGYWIHTLQTQPLIEWTWHSYAGHFGEFLSNPSVMGMHYLGTDDHSIVLWKTSTAFDCNIEQW